MNSVRPGSPRYVSGLLPAGTLFFMCGILLGRSMEDVFPAAAALLLALIAAGCLKRYLRMTALLLTALCLGTLLGCTAYHPALPEEGTVRVRATIVQEIALREDGQVQTILRDVELDGLAHADGAYWTFYLREGEMLPAAMKPGAQVSMLARAYHPGGRANPGSFDFREYLLQRDVTIGLYGAQELSVTTGTSPIAWIAGIRHSLSEKLMRVMGNEAGAYAAAMLLGSRDFLQEADRAAFSKLGIAHILSVSGYHVGVLTALMLLILRPLSLHRGIRLLLESAVLLAYCLLTGGNAPVIRAALLFLLRETSLLRRKQILPIHILCATACIQLVFSPTVLTSASFQLTYGAMLGLLLVYPRLRERRTCRTPMGGKLYEAFCAALSAQLGILLPQLYWFGELPLLALVLNMAVMAVASAVMTLYWLTLAALPVPILRQLLGAASAALTRLLLSGVRFLSQFDFTTLWTRQADLCTAAGWILLMLGLSAFPAKAHRWLRRSVLLIGTGLIALVLVPVPVAGTTYIQFSAGNADAALILDEGMVVAIDTGETGQELSGYLHRRRLGIDLLILTHLHSDHAGGLRALLDDGIPVRLCCLPLGAADAQVDPGLLPMLDELTLTGTELRWLSRGDVLPLPSGQLQVLWPRRDYLNPGQDANDSCLVMQAALHGTTLLLTADIPSRYDEQLSFASDVLKAAHHGSPSSNSAALLTDVAPQLILLPNADADRHESLAGRAGATPIFCTEDAGAVTLHFLPGGRFFLETFLPR